MIKSEIGKEAVKLAGTKTIVTIMDFHDEEGKIQQTVTSKSTS